MTNTDSKVFSSSANADSKEVSIIELLLGGTEEEMRKKGELIKRLYGRFIRPRETCISGRYVGFSIGGQPHVFTGRDMVVIGLVETAGIPAFKTVDSLGFERIVPCASVFEIDGMKLDRFAQAHMMGTRTKRGRSKR